MPGPIAPISGIAMPQAVRPAARTSGGEFQDVLAGAVRQVEAFGQDASSSVQRFLSGEGEELHNTIMATNRAELAFDMFLQTRNKVVNAYQEIMKMQL